MQINTSKFTIRQAQRKDIKILLEMIKELAVYENLLDKVTANEEILTDSLFIKEKAEAVIAEFEGNPVGYALYFYNFSTFLGRHGLYLEDIYIRPEYRGIGFGKNLFLYIVNLAKQQGCERVEWACLDWNEPSIKFYRQMGARPMDDWIIYRLDKRAIGDFENKI